MTLQEWQRLSTRISDTWGKSMREEMVATWFIELQSQQTVDVSDAVVNLARTEDRAPSLARLISASREMRRKRFSGTQQPALDGDALPEGVCALIRSSTHADVAVAGKAPWTWAECTTLPALFEATEIIGVQPS